MKKVLFIIVVGVLIFACKKESFEDVINVEVDCEKYIYEYTEAFDLSIHDSIKWFYETGCWSMEPVLDQNSYSDIVVNPNNSNEVIYQTYSTQELPERMFYKYNFCSNSNKPIHEGSYGFFTWTILDDIFFTKNSYSIYRMDSNGENENLVYQNDKFIYRLSSSPNGNMLLIEKDSLYLEYAIMIISNQGEVVNTFIKDGEFLGWLDNESVLFQKDNYVNKINVFTNEDELYLEGKYYSYDPMTERFFKLQIEDDYESWIISDKNGNTFIETEPHYRRGVQMIVPKFLGLNKIISPYFSHEFYPDKHIPSCNLLQKQRILLMDIDGSNIRYFNPLNW